MQTKAGTERLDAFTEEFLRVREQALRIAAKIGKRENELKTQLKRADWRASRMQLYTKDHVMSGPTSGWKLAFKKVAQRNPALIEEVAVEWEIQGEAVRKAALARLAAIRSGQDIADDARRPASLDVAGKSKAPRSYEDRSRRSLAEWTIVACVAQARENRQAQQPATASASIQDRRRASAAKELQAQHAAASTRQRCR